MTGARPPRRGAPKRGGDRPPLRPERILDVALGLADREGPEALSIRRVAQELGVTPMAVYNHFESKQDFLVAIVDHVVRTYRPLDHDEDDPRLWLRTTFTRLHRAMREHPSLVPLLDAWIAMGPRSVSMDVVEATLGVLLGAGLDERAAVRGFYTLICFTVGFAGVEASTEIHRKTEHGRAEGLRRYQLLFEDASIGRYPNVIRCALSLATAFEDDAFDVELGRIVDGVVGPPPSEPRKRATRSP